MSLTMTLGKRIALGIAIMLALMVVVGLAGYTGLDRVMKVTAFYGDVNEFQRIVASIKGDTDQYVMALYSGMTEQGEQGFKGAVVQLAHAMEMVGKIKEHSIVDAEEKKNLDLSKEDLRRYKKNMAEYAQSEKIKSQLALEIDSLYEPLLKKIEAGSLRMKTGIALRKISVTLLRVFRCGRERWNRAIN